MDWKSIETAPKDGTKVLLWDKLDPDGGIALGWWSEGEWRDEGDIGCAGQEDFQPTHWMPAPAGPQ